MINYNKNLFVVLIIYLMRIPAINCQFHTYSTASHSMRPIWKFSSFFQNNVQYQCYQKCIPVVQPQPQMMLDLCNKVCPFNPAMPDCIKCPKILSQAAPVMTIDEITKRLDTAEPEIIVIEPQSHAIFFKPEVVVAGYERKQCCYMDQCETVPIHAKCESRCYEPCDAVCTNKCRPNPQCPNQCEIVKQQLYKVQYKMWLANRLNEIKKKYRALAIECLLRTRLAFVQEVQKTQNEQPTFLGNEIPLQAIQNQIVPAQLVQAQIIPTQILSQLRDEEDDEPEAAGIKAEDDETQNNDYESTFENRFRRFNNNFDDEYNSELGTSNDAFENHEYFNDNHEK